MKAFFVCDQNDGSHCFVIPETDRIVPANKETMFQFISAQPDFAKWQGDSLANRPPDSLGLIVATRKEDGDVCIIEDALWQERMVTLLAAPS